MAVAQKYRDVMVRVFDIHTLVEPQLASNSECFQPAYAFLANRDQYNNAFAQELPLSTPLLKVVRLPATLDKKNKFWGAYKSIILNPKTPWEQQMPFAAYLNQNPFRPVRAKGLRGIFLDVTVYLNSLGWSTCFDFRLRGNFSQDALAEYIGRLSNKAAPEEGLLLLDGQPVDLAQAFMYVQDLMLKDVYDTTTFQPPPPAYRRLFVISIHHFTGDPIACCASMPGVDKAAFRKILYGGKPPALSPKAGNSLDLQWTEVVKPNNFATTDFNFGTLIFLQDDVATDQEQIHPYCFSKNVRDMFLTSYSLISYIEQSYGAPPDSRAGGLQANAAAILRQLPNKYKNQVCQTFFLNHNDLKPYRTK